MKYIFIVMRNPVMPPICEQKLVWKSNFTTQTSVGSYLLEKNIEEWFSCDEDELELNMRDLPFGLSANAIILVLFNPYNHYVLFLHSDTLSLMRRPTRVVENHRLRK